MALRRVAVMAAQPEVAEQFTLALAASLQGQADDWLIEPPWTCQSAERALPGRNHIVLLLALAPGADLAQEALDTLMRTALSRRDIAYHVIYGATVQEQLTQALQTLRRSQESATAPTGQERARWVWACDKCSDPDCEHRLFTERLRS